jgi:GAF domain-containing protein
VLPSSGASVAVTTGDRTLGHLVLTPREGSPAASVDRRLVLSLADHVAIALDHQTHRETTRALQEDNS